MKAILIIVILVLVGLSSFLFVSFNNAQSELALRDNELNSTRQFSNRTSADLITAQNELNNTKAELAAAKSALETVRQELASAKSATEAVNKELTSAKDAVRALRDAMANLQGTAESNQLTLKLAQAELSTAKAALKLYEDTYGQVFSNVQPPLTAAAGSNIELVRNTSAADPTWDELKSFLQQDLTDENVYDPASYNNVDYARDLFNNAGIKGIRSAFVSVQLKDVDVPRALNVFKTTDQGIVFIDVAGVSEGVKRPDSLDSTVRVKIGLTYQRELIFERGYYVDALGLSRIWTFPEGPLVTNVAVYW